MQERLQKVLSHAGYGSRRTCEKIIFSGRVSVNGKVAELGCKADSEIDKIVVDGNPIIFIKTEKIYIAFNKPRGVLSEIYSNPHSATVHDYIPIKEYLFIVGRLDKESEGLILLTNDGDLTNKLTHPRYQHEKEYQVLVNKEPDIKQLNAWRKGVIFLDGDKTSPAKVSMIKRQGGSYWLKVILHEGRRRQIREVGSIIGLTVERIIRTRISQIRLGDLKPGAWRKLSAEEIIKIKDPIS